MFITSFIIGNHKLKLCGISFSRVSPKWFQYVFHSTYQIFFNFRKIFPHEYIVLSSAKLKISDFSTERKISLMNILNNGPNLESCANFRPFAVTETFFSSMLKGNLIESQGYLYLIHMPLIFHSVNHVNHVLSFSYSGVNQIVTRNLDVYFF